MVEEYASIDRECPRCKKMIFISVKKADRDKYEGGMLVEDAFPYLSKGEQLMIIWGICGECYHRILED